MQLQTECSKQKLGSSMKNYRKQSSLGDQQQANMSIEIWKKAFADACERLCPVRAAGHECGCLPMLAKLASETIQFPFHLVYILLFIGPGYMRFLFPFCHRPGHGTVCGEA